MQLGEGYFAPLPLPTCPARRRDPTTVQGGGDLAERLRAGGLSLGYDGRDGSGSEGDLAIDPGQRARAVICEVGNVGAVPARRRHVVKRQIITLLAGGVLALALFSAALAGPLEDATAAYQRGDYVTALRLLRPLADQGNAAAQDALGVMYHEGQGVPQDYARALAWYRKAAEQGTAVAQFNLGAMYADGEGVPQDYARAIAWYRKAADQGTAVGTAVAQSNLGVMYAHGRGVPQDDAQALIWFRKAADLGYAAAQFNLGLTYDQGRGVPQDLSGSRRFKSSVYAQTGSLQASPAQEWLLP
jgi:hypothetical protein